MDPRREKQYHQYAYNQASHYAHYSKTAQQQHSAILSACQAKRANKHGARKSRIPIAVLVGVVLCMAAHLNGFPSPSGFMLGKMRIGSVEVDDDDDVALMQMGAQLRHRPNVHTVHILKLCADVAVVVIVFLAMQNMIPRLPSPVLESLPVPSEWKRPDVVADVCKRYNMGVCNTNHHRCKFAHYCMVCDDPSAKHRAFSRQCPHSPAEFIDIVGSTPPTNMICPPANNMNNKFGRAVSADSDRIRRNDHSWDSSQDSMIRNSSWRVQGERDGKLYWRGPPETRPRLHASQDSRGQQISRRGASPPVSRQTSWPGQSSYVTTRISRQH